MEKAKGEGGGLGRRHGAWQGGWFAKRWVWPDGPRSGHPVPTQIHATGTRASASSHQPEVADGFLQGNVGQADVHIGVRVAKVLELVQDHLGEAGAEEGNG